jgi:hypothetical protein
VAKRTDDQGRAYKKSQLQMQLYVNRRERALTEAVVVALPSLRNLKPTLHWVSPLEVERFGEYFDARFLEAIERKELAAALAEYWPSGGPHWDALAVAKSSGDEYLGPVLVEAKSWPGEMRSKIDASETSEARIAGRLRETREWLGVSDEHESAWLDRWYQAANRYAHLRWFLDVLGEPAWLANIYFLDDADKPTGQDAWDTAITAAEADLGLADVTVPNAGRVFLKAGKRAELLVSATSE